MSDKVAGAAFPCGSRVILSEIAAIGTMEARSIQGRHRITCDIHLKGGSTLRVDLVSPSNLSGASPAELDSVVLEFNNRGNAAHRELTNKWRDTQNIEIVLCL